MGEERLIEITSEISKSEGPLWTMGYVTSLHTSEIYLLFKYVGSSKYNGLNVCDALFAFANDYLRSKGLLTESSYVDMFLDDEKNKNINVLDDVLFYSQALTGEQTVNQGKGRR